MTDEQGQEVKKKSGCGKSIGIGCLVVILLLVAVGGIGFSMRFKIMGKFARTMAEQTVSGLQLGDAEKEAVMKPINKLITKVEAGEVGLDELKKLGEALTNGPLVPMMMAKGVEAKYLPHDELTDEENEKARVSVSRFMQGLISKDIDSSDAQKILSSVTETTAGANGAQTSQLKESLSAEEVQEVVRKMRSAADGAGVEDREHTIDIAGEIAKIVEAGLSTEE